MVVKLKTASILLTGWNARNVDVDNPDPATIELAAALLKQHLLHPIVVRHSKTEGHYDLIAGERRLAAYKINGVEEIDASIISVSDDELREYMLSENCNRQNLTPFEEAEALNVLIKKLGITGDEELAASLGWSVTKVRRRARLQTLTKAAKTALDKAGSPLVYYERIAALSADLQSKVTESNLYYIRSVKELDERIARYLCDLSKAPFTMDDKLGSLPVCQKCSSRTSCVPDLFADSEKDQQKENRCLNPECFNKKATMIVANLIEANPELPLFVEWHSNLTPYSPVITTQEIIRSANGGTKIKAICVYGPKIGKIITINVMEKAAAKTQGTKKKEVKELTKKEAVEQLEDKRRQHEGKILKIVHEKFLSYLRSSESELVNITVEKLFFLCVLSGMRTAGCLIRSDWSKRIEEFGKSGMIKTDKGLESPQDIIIDCVIDAMADDILIQTADHAVKVADQYRVMAQQTSFDYDAVLAEVTAENPEPKSWGPLKVIAGEAL